MTHKSLCELPPLSALRCLKAEACKGLARLSLALPASHPLADINLRSCPSLKEVDLKLDSLQVRCAARGCVHDWTLTTAAQVLTLTACKMLTHVKLRTPALTTLLANQCAHLRDVTFACAAPALTYASLMGCNEIPSAALTHALPLLPGLRRLSVAACLALTVLIVPGAALSCGCATSHRGACLTAMRRLQSACRWSNWTQMAAS